MSAQPHSIHLLIPMSGRGRRFARAGYTMCKPLVPVDGAPMIERVLEQYPANWPAHFVTSTAHAKSALPKLLRALRPHAPVHAIDPHDEGPSHAVRAALSGIPADAPVLVSYCDFGMHWDPAAFARFVADSRCDACLLSYRGYQPHYASNTPYAYSRLHQDQVAEVREKGSFTATREAEYASAGAYYFRTRTLLEEALRAQLELNLRAVGEMYTSLTVQALLQIRPQSDVRVFEIQRFFQWGTPEDLAEYNHWSRAVRTWLKAAPARGARWQAEGFEAAQLAMPMAGRGSRLAAIAHAPKPLVPLGDVGPMFVAAAASLPRPQAAQAFAALRGHRGRLQPWWPRLPGPTAQVRWLDQTPPGQAHSTLEAIAGLDDDLEVVVSACDHAIAIAPSTWRAFHAAPDCEAAIFGVSGYPGAARRPLHYAYAKTAATAGDAAPSPSFQKVTEVAVKQAVGGEPHQQHVVTGTFWFRRVGRLKEAIAALKLAGAEVNGELYLDSVFAWLLAQGEVVRLVPVDGFFNWGTPDALDESQHWMQALGGKQAFAQRGATEAAGQRAMVEPIGIEPTTSGLQSPRSPN